MVAVYRVTDSFPRHELYGLTSQVRRSANSVVAHIAEAAGRFSHGEKRQLLSQGRGSLFETKAHLIAARELGYLDAERYAALEVRVDDVSCPLSGLIRYVKQRESLAKRPSRK